MKHFYVNNLPAYYKLFPKLSRREIEVLSMSCAGLDRNEIAIELNISVHTVNNHFNNAVTKYELKNLGKLKALFYFVINESRVNSADALPD
ncbi:helix-turn-helix transcriptional regulator (plasmid) [Candidatus Williamhamiltonella defendens]|uniref:Helix-turn-helix transcriptional regulator n=2 Tax=Candidatus Williamhamiltonella defendens TaxID=138072 RepID=A0A2D3T584_9ENTR|nr:helix-turn-helix transcriptional regulator [Candidatus Hamiltonella defensa]ASV34562.1 helix-turn-helix transcriptional regulator [Candidatus Hamiltonella defensa]ATW30955.1 helix-turn-helix transcriptional regulator [Candidatus Hamiltonella defensa]ATW32844.1 helix-turn-helix transcriptional regulator [Candidatus Hamiltonella defensa]AWK17522.1 helix-turn-helix transcriptional regulator [Candidatus Hamiltonella defensa]MBK4362074.1 LuxR family transcriptional regulator [Candidatus Hamilton